MKKQYPRAIMVDEETWAAAGEVGDRIGVSKSAMVQMGLRAIIGMLDGETPTLRALVESEGGNDVEP